MFSLNRCSIGLGCFGIQYQFLNDVAFGAVVPTCFLFVGDVFVYLDIQAGVPDAWLIC